MNDLCASVGIPGRLDHEQVRSAYARCADACRRHGKHLGVRRAAHPNFTAKLIQLGARYVTTETDLAFLVSAATASAIGQQHCKVNAR